MRDELKSAALLSPALPKCLSVLFPNSESKIMHFPRISNIFAMFFSGYYLTAPFSV